jgi:hypothetical protein
MGGILTLERYNSAGVSPTERVGAAMDRERPEQSVLRARPMILTLFVSFCTMVGFFLLLSVVPLYAESAGGES